MNNVKYKVFDLVENLRTVDLEIENLKSKHEELRKKIKEICHHPEDFLEHKSIYYDGDYYNTAYTDSWVECSLCHTGMNLTTKRHGYYG